MLDDNNCDDINMCVLLRPHGGHALRMFLAYTRDDLHHSPFELWRSTLA